MPPPRTPRNTDLESNTAPDLIDEDRRRDLPETRPDTLGERVERGEETPAGGGFSPTADGGNAQHPVHDEDDEDPAPEDFEREIDQFDGPVDEFDKSDEETTH
ncbi:hypothetical protein [Undibacter mobilis]|uniref:Uncharacterized protein n=1 Tax=Undibacter mobilis TaxID=2292256 RepID=A0A371BD25_9BRAD|nr:hypothetical protein [Undibacter mobilis]RDV05468.1 hypothetical protein DXH78_13325 [Undibacter mobilis]